MTIAQSLDVASIGDEDDALLRKATMVRRLPEPEELATRQFCLYFVFWLSSFG